MPRPVHFDIPADDPGKLSGFYRNVFGWKFQKWDGPMEYWLISTGAEGERGIDGGMGPKMEGGAPCNTIDVPDVNAFAEKITQKGGQVVVPRMPVQGIGWMAFCRDPEGNPFGIMQFDPAAR